MTMIMRDLMEGNSKLAEMGFGEEALGHNAVVGGFQGQRHWTDHLPNGDFSDTILNSSFDWNGIREPFVIATENDSLNGVNMLFGKMLTGQAQVFCDVRTYWSQDSVERVSGYRPEAGFIHLVNSGSAALDGSGEAKDQHGESVIKPHWDMSAEDAEACLSATCCTASRCRILPWGWFLFKLPNAWWYAIYDAPYQYHQRHRSCAANRGGSFNYTAKRSP